MCLKHESRPKVDFIFISFSFFSLLTHSLAVIKQKAGLCGRYGNHAGHRIKSEFEGIQGNLQKTRILSPFVRISIQKCPKCIDFCTTKLARRLNVPELMAFFEKIRLAQALLYKGQRKKICNLNQQGRRDDAQNDPK